MQPRDDAYARAGFSGRAGADRVSWWPDLAGAGRRPQGPARHMAHHANSLGTDRPFEIPYMSDTRKAAPREVPACDQETGEIIMAQQVGARHDRLRAAAGRDAPSRAVVSPGTLTQRSALDGSTFCVSLVLRKAAALRLSEASVPRIDRL